MLNIEKTYPEMIPVIFAAVVLITLLAVYGRYAVEWILMKLYEFFIQNNPVNL
jgi:hypothetical protein